MYLNKNIILDKHNLLQFNISKDNIILSQSGLFVGFPII